MFSTHDTRPLVNIIIGPVLLNGWTIFNIKKLLRKVLTENYFTVVALKGFNSQRNHFCVQFTCTISGIVVFKPNSHFFFFGLSF